jgi:hypothetical protein
VTGISVGGVILNNHHTHNGQGIDAIKAEVGRHYLLPGDEQPALATITDKQKLSSKLFKLAVNGDKVLIYQKNHIAIVYRQSLDKIISVGPVLIDQAPVK